MITTKLLYFLVFCFIPKNILVYADSGHIDEQLPTLTPEQHLFTFTLEGFKNMTSFYVNKAANISELILRDATLNKAAVGNFVLQEFKQNLTDFLSKYEKHQEFEDLFELVELYSNTTTDYYEIPLEKLTPDTALLVNVLRKYGSEQLDKDFRVIYDKFVEDFKKEFEKVEISLERKMLDWYEEFKHIKEMNARTEAFEKFIMFYL